MGRDISVGKATRYSLGVPGIEFRWGWDFPHTSRRALGPTELHINGYRVSLKRVKRLGRGVVHPLAFSAEVKESIELYPYSLSGHLWSVLRRTYLTPLTGKATQVYTFIHSTCLLYQLYCTCTIYSTMLKSFNSLIVFNCYKRVVWFLCNTLYTCFDNLMVAVWSTETGNQF